MTARKRPCAAVVDVAGRTYGCALDAPHAGTAHHSPESDGAPVVNWCSDSEARRAQKGMTA